MKIVTNHRQRPFTYRMEVPEKVLKDQFEHLPEEMDGFFKYRNWWYHVSDFERTNIKGWDGIRTDTFFSGTVIKVSDDGEEFKVGYAYC